MITSVPGGSTFMTQIDLLYILSLGLKGLGLGRTLYLWGKILESVSHRI
jgi:hypothetical protein